MRFFLLKVTNASKRSGYRLSVAAICLSMVFGSLVATTQQAEAVRFTSRSLYINSSVPGATTFYTVSFTFPTNSSVGSLQMLFCTEAIAYLPCDPPQGLDVSGAILSAQSGVSNFAITDQTSSKIVMTRPASSTGVVASKYTFTNVKNPTHTPGTFYIRLNSFASNNATGAFIDYGSVASSTALQMNIETQVPAILIFCTGKEIPAFDCADATGDNFDEFEEPSVDEPMFGQTEMMAYTNARSGYVISVLGRSLTSGIYEIPAITEVPQESLPGKGQFGINLTSNTNPDVGANPVGPASNYDMNPDYIIPDKFLFNNGDALVTSDYVTLNKKYTVSYIVNVPEDQHPGVYNTTVTLICTGNF